jgi:hypothetical protein
MGLIEALQQSVVWGMSWWVRGLIGCAFGGAGLILLPLLFVKKDHPMAQNFGIITHNQSGGTNTVNIGPQRLTFNQEVAEKIAAELSNDKQIIFESVGNHADQAVAAEYLRFLEQRGFRLEWIQGGIVSPPPNQKISIDKRADRIFVTIAPNAN